MPIRIKIKQRLYNTSNWYCDHKGKVFEIADGSTYDFGDGFKHYKVSFGRYTGQSIFEGDCVKIKTKYVKGRVVRCL